VLARACSSCLLNGTSYKLAPAKVTSNLKPKKMKNDTLASFDYLSDVIGRNQHMLAPSKLLKRLYHFNNRLIISENLAFLEAIQKETGGEIIIDAEIGGILYLN
jgi:hypothetical protein